MKKLAVLIIFFILSSCSKGKSKTIETLSIDAISQNEYATGFNIIAFDSFKVLEIKNPWPKSDKSYRYLLLSKEEKSEYSYNKEDYDGVITVPVNTIVVTSTTHIPALELLDVEKTLVGFPGTDYISSNRTRSLIDNGDIRELGENEGINTEVLLNIKPDVVIGYGVDGNNKTLETIKNSGIPVVYNGDWVEKSPLAKAEWIKFFGALYNKEKEADSIFKKIEADYLQAKTLASKVIERPTVLCGAMYKDVWYLPNGTSPEAQILKDANVNYLWSETTGKGSLSLSFETVFEKAKQANLWLSPSY